MKYQNSRQITLLSAEYVLGTLRGRARQRFKKLLLTRPDIRQQVLEWENHFATLNDQIEPSAVPNRIWQRINHHLFEPAAPAQSTAWQSLWKSWALIATTASVLLIGLLLVDTQRWLPPAITPFSEAGFVSVFQDKQQRAVWSVSIRPDQQSIAITPIEVPELAANQDYQLWLLPKSGQPISLGLMSATQRQRLPIRQASFAGGVSLAVSLEPKGGSPTGQPTGDILYVAQVLPAG